MIKRLVIFAMAVFLAFVLFFIFGAGEDTGKIYAHIYVHGVAVGGMNRDEARAALLERFQAAFAERVVQYKLDGQTVADVAFWQLGAMLDFEAQLNEALEYSYLRDFSIRISSLLGRAYNIDSPPGYTIDPNRLEDVMRELSAKVDVIPQNASFSRADGEINLSKEADGQGVDIEAAVAATRAVLDSFASGEVELKLVSVNPAYSLADLDFAKVVLGSFNTALTDGEKTPRGRNVLLAAQRINNQMLYPGEVFSAGQKIMANIPDSGYEAAVVLVRGAPIEDMGGGVCQVVTTLYNAVLWAELEVVQRHNHSSRVSYAELGFDATVAGDYFDLKFRNNTDRPLLITSQAADGRLHVEIIGYETRPAQRSIRFEAAKTEEIKPEPNREIVDQNIPRGQRVVTLEPQLGFRVELTKVVYMDGVEAERYLVNTSTYKPLQGVVAIGAG
ncbi:MAG: VanW family protein [Defluviitaleaceae bacterium]|nr:VanW family protein [Defluviitaleaceae bacterium]